MMLKEKRYQSHRGYCQNGAMENTLASLEAAGLQGSSMVEFDVRLTKDYVVVLYHDANLKRLHRAGIAVADLTLAQMKVFAPNVATFEEVLTDALIPEFLNVELKTDAKFDPSLEIAVTKLIKKHRAEERVVLSSFNPLSLMRARGLAPDIARALLVTQDDEAGNYWFLKSMSLLPLCAAQYLHWDEKMITPERTRKFIEAGYQIAAWTVNDVGRARELFDIGVESVISDTLLPKTFHLAEAVL